MIKQYFSVTLVAASLVMAGCSSSDDDDPTAGTTTAGTTTAGTTTAGTTTAGTTTAGTTTPATCAACDAPDVTLNLAETATLDGSFLQLLAAADAAGIALDDDAGYTTVFAPNDDAFDALPEGTVDALAAEDLAHLLNYHLVGNSALSAADLIDGTVLTMANGQDATITVAGDVVSIGDVAISMSDIYATNGVIHVLSAVLTPPEVIDPGTTTEGTTTEGTTTAGTTTAGGGVMGAVETAVAASGNYSEFLGQFDSGIGNPALDDAGNAWTVFAPSNTALAGAVIDTQEYVHVGGALDAATLAGMSEIVTNNSGSYAVAGTADALTVNGHAVSVIASGTSIVYSIEGTLP